MKKSTNAPPLNILSTVGNIIMGVTMKNKIAIIKRKVFKILIADSFEISKKISLKFSSKDNKRIMNRNKTIMDVREMLLLYV